MTKEAVRDEFRVFIAEVSDYIERNVEPSNVVLVPAVVPDRAFEAAARPVVRREISVVGDTFVDKFDIVAEAADDEVEPYIDEYVRADIFYGNFEGDDQTRRDFRNDLVERFGSIVEAARPMVRSDEEEFWQAVRDTYGRAEAVEALQGNFRYADTVEEYADDVVLDVSLGIGSARKQIDYTDEALRVLDGGEKELRESIEQSVNTAYSYDDA